MGTLQNAIAIFSAGVEAVNPSALVRNCLTWQRPYLTVDFTTIEVKPESKIFVTGAGKASALMAQTVEDILGDVITGGIVVTKYEHGADLQRITQIEAGHPLPDLNSITATKEILKLVSNLSTEDVVFFLLSGGASSLMADYPEGTHLQEVQKFYEVLLGSGADIHEMNTVRKHLSGVKGGQLAMHIYPAKLFSLILSDVPGDQLDIIGSGPTVPDQSSFEDAWNILTKYKVANTIAPSIVRHFKEGLEGKLPDTPKEGDPHFENCHNIIIGNNSIALKAAAEKARELGYSASIVTSRIQGEASVIGKRLAEEAIAFTGPRPACLLYGGESTVTIRGTGLGGRNTELALAAGIEILSHPNITILSAGTDGTDGPTDAAGAVVDSALVKKAIENKYDPMVYLKDNDSYHFFAPFQGLIETGATQTNVMDIIVLLIH
ncbi:MAG: glycerate kinase type-2 family protein [Flavisolibacter sp.]